MYISLGRIQLSLPHDNARKVDDNNSIIQFSDIMVLIVEIYWSDTIRLKASKNQYFYFGLLIWRYDVRFLIFVLRIHHLDKLYYKHHFIPLTTSFVGKSLVSSAIFSCLCLCVLFYKCDLKIISQRRASIRDTHLYKKKNRWLDSDRNPDDPPNLMYCSLAMTHLW